MYYVYYYDDWNELNISSRPRLLRLKVYQVSSISVIFIYSFQAFLLTLKHTTNSKLHKKSLSACRQSKLNATELRQMWTDVPDELRTDNEDDWKCDKCSKIFFYGKFVSGEMRSHWIWNCQFNSNMRNSLIQNSNMIQCIFGNEWGSMRINARNHEGARHDKRPLMGSFNAYFMSMNMCRETTVVTGAISNERMPNNSR